MQIADRITRNIIGKYVSPEDWFDVRKQFPNFIIDGQPKVIKVRVRHADGREEDTIYQGFGQFGYAPDFMEDVTHWQVLPQDFQ